MNNRGVFGDPETVKKLAEHLMKIPRLARVVGLDDAAEDAWAIATGLKDIGESMDKIFNELLPELLAAEPKSTKAAELLYSIGEEYRHVQYHIIDTRFFGYIANQQKLDDESLLP